MIQTTVERIEARIDRLDWQDLARHLDERGFAVTEPVLGAEECVELAELFDGDGFRSAVEMARHGFGDGRYRYFAVGHRVGHRFPVAPRLSMDRNGKGQTAPALRKPWY